MMTAGFVLINLNKEQISMQQVKWLRVKYKKK